MLSLSPCPSFTLFIATFASFAFLSDKFFSALGDITPQILNVTSNHSCHIKFLFSGLKMAFTKLNLARYHSLHKNRFNLATLFHIFSYHRTSLQIFLFHKFSCISLSQVVELEMPGNSSTIFRSSHRRCSVKKVFSNILWYSQENTCVGASLLINLQLISPVALLKRDSNTDFLVDLGQFLRTPILKNICEGQHFWKVFCKNIFEIRTLQRKILMKQKWSLLCESLLKLVKTEQKSFLSYSTRWGKKRLNFI